jgi:hypothetical protein
MLAYLKSLAKHRPEWAMSTIIDTAVKESQRKMFLDHKLYPSMERLINSDSAVTHLKNPSTLRKLEDGYDTFSETSVRTRATRRYKVAVDLYNMKELAVILVVYTETLTFNLPNTNARS